MKYIIKAFNEFRLLFLPVVPFVIMIIIGLYLNEFALIGVGLVTVTCLSLLVVFGIIMYWSVLRKENLVNR